MIDGFFKFPTTPHLATFSVVDIRADKVMSESERNEFLQHKIIVEEKVDGANLGISFDDGGNICVQNRGSYLHLPWVGQWKKLQDWLASRMDELFDVLSNKYILFGEWCYAQHSIFYDRLPDWFLGFDIFDREFTLFLSSIRCDEFFSKMGIVHVPLISRGYFTLFDLNKLISKSKISREAAEGLYLRIEQGEWLLQRAKLVRPEFIQSVEKHWSHSTIKPNKLSFEGDE